MYLDSRDTVVISDPHAHADKLRLLQHIYGDVRKIINGDLMDGENTRDAYEVVGEFDMLLGTGNHEWVSGAVMQQPKGFVRDYYLDRWRHNDKRFISYERGTLSSYGVDPRLPNEAAADALRNAMDSAGHLALLNSAELYFETDEYIVVHAGLSTTPWMVQRKELDTYRQMVAHRDYSAAPEQVFDTSDAHNKTH